MSYELKPYFDYYYYYYEPVSPLTYIIPILCTYILLLCTAYVKPIGKDKTQSLLIACIFPFAYVVVRSVKNPLRCCCGGTNPAGSMLFGIFLMPLYLIFVLLEPEVKKESGLI